MKRDEEFDMAEQRLRSAGEALGAAVEARLAREAVLVDAEAEIQRMTADRGRLARELDTALALTVLLVVMANIGMFLVDVVRRVVAPWYSMTA